MTLYSKHRPPPSLPHDLLQPHPTYPPLFFVSLGPTRRCFYRAPVGWAQYSPSPSRRQRPPPPTPPWRPAKKVGIGMDRFRVPELLVNTSPLTDALSGASGGGGVNSSVQPSPGLKTLAESLSRPGFAIRPLQVQTDSCPRVYAHQFTGTPRFLRKLYNFDRKSSGWPAGGMKLPLIQP